MVRKVTNADNFCNFAQQTNKERSKAMKVIDKYGKVLYEGEPKHRERAFMGTARIRRKANWVRKPYKVVSKEDFDAGLY